MQLWGILSEMLVLLASAVGGLIPGMVGVMGQADFQHQQEKVHMTLTDNN